MEAVFISNKPWVDETIRLRKALFFTTIFMIILGVIIEVIGIALLSYMEFVVGVIALVFGILLPVGYIGANVFLLAKRRKDYDKNMIIEYRFTEDALEIIRLSDSYKSKDVVGYNNLSVNKVFDKSRFIVLKTNSYYNDYIVLRKSDIKIGEGETRNQAIVSFVSFLMSKVAEANRVGEVTCAMPSEEDEPINLYDEVDNAEVSDIEDVPALEDVIDESEAVGTLDTPDDVEEDDEDIKVDEDMNGADELLDDAMMVDSEEEQSISNDVAEVEEPVEDAIDSDADSTDLFKYDETLLSDDDTKKSEEPATPYLHDYTFGEDTKGDEE